MTTMASRTSKQNSAIHHDCGILQNIQSNQKPYFRCTSRTFWEREKKKFPVASRSSTSIPCHATSWHWFPETACDFCRLITRAWVLLCSRHLNQLSPFQSCWNILFWHVGFKYTLPPPSSGFISILPITWCWDSSIGSSCKQKFISVILPTELVYVS